LKKVKILLLHSLAVMFKQKPEKVSMDSFFQAAKSEGFDDEVIEKLKGEVSLD